MDKSNYDRLIIDGNNFIFRAYHIKRHPIMVNDINTTPIHQFLYMLKNIVNQFNPTEIILTWDRKINTAGSNFRKELVAYKAQREESNSTREIYDYINYIQPFMDALGIITLYPNNFEADDIISFITGDNTDELKTIIVSSDKDLLQLVSSSVDVFLPNKNTIITKDNFENEIGICQQCFLLYKTILGDVSDNISGLFRYGPVKAKKLAEDIILNKGLSYNDIIEYPLSSMDEQTFDLNEEQLELIQRNLKIMDLKYNHPTLIEEYHNYTQQYTNMLTYFGVFNVDKFRDRCYHYNFINFIREIGTWRSLFDKNNKNNTEEDLLSHISM